MTGNICSIIVITILQKVFGDDDKKVFILKVPLEIIQTTRIMKRKPMEYVLITLIDTCILFCVLGQLYKFQGQHV